MIIVEFQKRVDRGCTCQYAQGSIHVNMPNLGFLGIAQNIRCKIFNLLCTTIDYLQFVDLLSLCEILDLFVS